jgi:hypothetical protein
VKYDLTLSTAALDKVQVGVSIKAFRIRYDARSPFGNDTPYSPVPGVDPFTLTTSLTAYQSAAYLQATKKLNRRVSVTVGGRLDHYNAINALRVSPRAGATLTLSDRVSWRTSYGAYYQPPAFLFVAAFPQNAALLPWRADHYVSGLEWLTSTGLRVTVEAYRKNYRDYPVASGLPSLSLANIGDTFDVREILFPLTSGGRGRSQGVEMFLEKRLTSKLYGQANLSFSRTRHGGLDGVLRPGSFDYPYVVNVVGGYRFSTAWEVSTRVSLLAGRPYTPYDERTSALQRRGVYDLSRVNGERAAAYTRLDLRVDRSLTVGGQPLNVFLGVQNLTNRRNFGGFSWNRRTNDIKFGEQQGVFPILGADWRF